MESTIKRAAIYGRYSSHNQKDTSIEQQFTEIRRYCADNGITIIAEYADRAISGTTDDRPEFQRMIKDSAKGKFNYVVVWKVDRFARNRYDSATYKARLKKHGVKVLYAKESIPDGPEGILLEALLEGSAEYYSANLSQNIKRGREANAREGKSNGSLSLGYRKRPDGTIELDPVEAEVVRRIYQMYTAGTSSVEICETLNRLGYRTKQGKPFGKNSLRTILYNERYTGVYIFGDIRIEGGIPAIVDRDTYEKALKMLAYHAKAPAASADIHYLLTGKLFCGHCQEPMIGMSGTGKSGSKFAYYACANKRRGTKTCDKKNVRKDDIETVVVQRTLDTILTDEIMEQIADAAVRLQEAERDTSVLDGLKSRLRETEKALQNFVKAIEMGIFNETTASRMEQLEAEKKDLINLIELEQIEKPFITKDQILYILDCFRHGDPSDESFREHIIDVFISKVYLYDDNRLKIIYTYNNQSEESDFPSDFPENENEAETHPGHNAGMCSTSHNLVEQIHPNANTSIYINTRCIMLLTFFHVSTK